MKYKEKWVEANYTLMENWNIVFDLMRLIKEKGLTKQLGNADLELLKVANEYLDKPLFE